MRSKGDVLGRSRPIVGSATSTTLASMADIAAPSVVLVRAIHLY
jgi:hypothetical protein